RSAKRLARRPAVNDVDGLAAQPRVPAHRLRVEGGDVAKQANAGAVGVQRHAALAVDLGRQQRGDPGTLHADVEPAGTGEEGQRGYVRTRPGGGDRKSTRLNSSHVSISYAVFC